MSNSYENRFVKDMIPLGFPGETMEGAPAWRTAQKSGDVALGLPGIPVQIVEVKKVAHPSKVCVSAGGNREQFEQMKRFATEHGIGSWYAVYHTRGSRDGRWRLHEMPGHGDPTLKREDGLRLEAFVNQLVEASNLASGSS